MRETLSGFIASASLIDWSLMDRLRLGKTEALAASRPSRDLDPASLCRLAFRRAARLRRLACVARGS
jgi:hypothetical protein